MPDGAPDTTEPSFLDTIYNKINDVIGGDNPNQYFCLTLPGTQLSPEDYSYDIKGEKPAHVKANESKLVNKLFDASFITASDNGRRLQNQYKTALSMLSPKLNRDLFEMKVQLRKVLMTPYQYDFGDGNEWICRIKLPYQEPLLQMIRTRAKETSCRIRQQMTLHRY